MKRQRILAEVKTNLDRKTDRKTDTKTDRKTDTQFLLNIDITGEFRRGEDKS